MKAYYDEGGITIYHGDCREVLPTLGPFAAVVTDPPYGISFMGKGWDRDTPGVEYWKIVKAALVPGAHLLAMGGTRTFHQLACAIKDAGFEIRDVINYLYGMGWPKSLDVGKAIDKASGVEREVIGKYTVPTDSDSGNAGRVIKSSGKPGLLFGGGAGPEGRDITAPATEDAKRWDGFGTALKPACELICLARKPLSEKTVAANVLKHGTGALNIDGCRIPISEGKPVFTHYKEGERSRSSYDTGGGNRTGETSYEGRWPANVIHDGSDEVVGMFPSPHGAGHARSGSKNPRESVHNPSSYHLPQNTGDMYRLGDSGSAARFFYCAKVRPNERGKSDHPTMKPVALMRYLCRLVTPPGGVVLDPFMGSGSTLVAAQAESFHAVGVELEEKYCEIAANRLSQQVFDFDESAE